MRTRKLRIIALLLGIFLPITLFSVDALTDTACDRGLLGFLRSENAYVTFTGEFIETSSTGAVDVIGSENQDIIDSIDINDPDIAAALGRDTPIKVNGIYAWPLFDYNNAPFIDYFIVAFISGLLLLFYFYTSEKLKPAVGLRRFLYFLLYLFYVIIIEFGIFSLILGLDFSRCFES